MKELSSPPKPISDTFIAGENKAETNVNNTKIKPVIKSIDFGTVNFPLSKREISQNKNDISTNMLNSEYFAKSEVIFKNGIKNIGSKKDNSNKKCAEILSNTKNDFNFFRIIKKIYCLNSKLIVFEILYLHIHRLSIQN